MSGVKENTLKGIKWSAVERFALQFIQFVFGIILARLLLPSDYGIIGMTTVFLSISQTFSDSGFANALIRKVDRTELDNSTAFYFNIGIGCVVYCLLFILSPFIASFFNMHILKDVIRVIGLKVIFDAFAIVQKALYTINVDFKTMAKVSVISVLTSGVLGIWFAYKGYGVWALVIQILLNSILSSTLYWFYSKWRPLKSFSISSFKELFSFGSKLMLSNIIGTIYNEFISLLIGKKFNSATLGIYTRAQQFSRLPSGTFMEITQRVTFPILAGIQNDDEKLTKVYRKYIRSSSLVIFILMAMLMAMSKPVILLLLTEKWIECVPLLQIICLSSMTYHISAINLNLLQVKGRSDLFLNLEIIKRVISVSMMIIAVQWGVVAVCWALVIYGQFAIMINAYYTGKILGVGYWLQMKDYLPYFICSMISVAPAYVLSEYVDIPNIISVILGGLLSLGLYIAILQLKKDDMYIELKESFLSKYIRK